jgi:hypothetical protein
MAEGNILIEVDMDRDAKEDLRQIKLGRAIAQVVKAVVGVGGAEQNGAGAGEEAQRVCGAEVWRGLAMITAFRWWLAARLNDLVWLVAPPPPPVEPRRDLFAEGMLAKGYAYDAKMDMWWHPDGGVRRRKQGIPND